MAGKPKNPSSIKTLNPNWAQLIDKLKANTPKNNNKFAKQLHTRDAEKQNSIPGKCRERSEEELNHDSQDSKANPLIPTSTDCSLTDAVAMDCEMVGVGLQGNKSALARVTLVNKWGNVTYDEYVRPVEYVVDFRTEISGIRQRDLKKAKNFNVVQTKVAELIKGKILVGHALRNDLRVLMLTHPKKDIRDSSEYVPFLKDGRSRSLKSLAAEFLDAEIQNGEHCPVEDARAAMQLYQKNRKLWERSIKDYVRRKENPKRRRR